MLVIGEQSGAKVSLAPPGTPQCLNCSSALAQPPLRAPHVSAVAGSFDGPILLFPHVRFSGCLRRQTGPSPKSSKSTRFLRLRFMSAAPKWTGICP